MSDSHHKGFLGKLKAVFAPQRHKNGAPGEVESNVERYKSILNDPNSSEEAKKHAREELDKLGIE